MMLVDSFEEAGFKVYEAAHADEALRVLQARDDIMVVVTDVEMPTGSMDGFELARRVHERIPSVGVLVASGRRAPAPGDLPEGMHFIAKPFHPDTVIQLVRSLMPTWAKSHGKLA